jgi:hypothetical protein
MAAWRIPRVLATGAGAGARNAAQAGVAVGTRITRFSCHACGKNRCTRAFLTVDLDHSRRRIMDILCACATALSGDRRKMPGRPLAVQAVF